MKPVWFGEVTPATFNDTHDGSLAHSSGVAVTEVRPDRLLARMPYFGSGNASLSIMAESLGSIAAVYTVDPARFTVVGVDINLSSVAVPRPGSVILAEVYPVSSGQKLQLWVIDLRDEAGTFLATSRITTLVVPLAGQG